MKQFIVSVMGGILLTGTAIAETRVIDSFVLSGSSSGPAPCPTTSSTGSSTSIPIPNSFPPGNDPDGVIGSTGDPMAERRLDDVRSGDGIGQFFYALNVGSHNGEFFIDAGPGCLLEHTLTYDGIETPGTGLNGQNLRDLSECQSPNGTADRFELDFAQVDPDLAVEIAVTDTSNNIATLPRTGLQAGREPFRYADFANAGNTDFSSVDKITVKFSAGGNDSMTLNAIEVACDPNDLDGDGITNSQDTCLDSDLLPTVVVADCDSGVTNTLFPSGCTIADRVTGCPAGNKQRACVTKLTGQMAALKILTTQQQGAITGCVP